MLEIGSILEKFNTINSQLIQYWWYNFAVIATGILAILNLIVIGLILYDKLTTGSVAGSSIIVPLGWGISLLIFFLVIVPIGFILYLISNHIPTFTIVSLQALAILKQITIFFWYSHIAYFISLVCSVLVCR